jgi:hypothetical protein
MSHHRVHAYSTHDKREDEDTVKHVVKTQCVVALKKYMMSSRPTTSFGQVCIHFALTHPVCRCISSHSG